MAKDICFVVGRPLQYLISSLLKDEMFVEANCSIVIVEYFEGAAELAAKAVHKDIGWQNVYLAKNKKQAFKWVGERKFGKVFTDSDVGIQNTLSLLRLKLKQRNSMLCIAEEGVGTYRNEIYSPLKTLALKMISVSSVMGGSWLVDEILVFDPELHRERLPRLAKKVNRIPSDLQGYMKRKQEMLANVFQYRLPETFERTNTVSVYLGAYEQDSSVVEQVTGSADVCVYKPHPYIGRQGVDEHGFDYVCPASIPSELLIMGLSRVCHDVVVFHHGSSTERYASAENVDYRLI